MKKFTLVIATLTFCVVFSQSANSQVNFRVQVNVGAQPEWGPAGYDAPAYYYMPDIEAYYDVPRGLFVYLSNGRWTFSAALPARYAGYDLYRGYKVVINRPNAYYYFNEDRMRYGCYRDYYGRQECRGRFDDRGYGRRDRDDDNGRGYERGRGWKNGHYKHHGRFDD